MLFDKQYDFVFGIGGACSCTQILRKCRLQFNSYPFDWLFGADILTRTKLLANNFEDFINFEDLEDTGNNNEDANNLCENYHNKKNDITFNHDFKYGKPLTETYGCVKEKYDRRIKRLISQIEKSNNVLVVFLQAPNDDHAVEDGILIESHTILKTRFPKQNISLLYLFCKHGNKDFVCKEIQEDLTRVEYDYDAYDKMVPYAVDNNILRKQLCKVKITNKFIDKENLYRRYVFLVKCFLRGLL
jgi:hypothetical protein